MENFRKYVEFIEEQENNCHDCKSHLDSEGEAYAPMQCTEPGSLFDSLEDAA